jgi:hypothetical protein
VLDAVWRYLEERVVVEGDPPPEEVAPCKYKRRIIERLTGAMEPETEGGKPPTLPVIGGDCPPGSTSEVLFRTVRPGVGTTKSHISPGALDAPRWERRSGCRKWLPMPATTTWTSPSPMNSRASDMGIGRTISFGAVAGTGKR